MPEQPERSADQVEGAEAMLAGRAEEEGEVPVGVVRAQEQEPVPKFDGGQRHAGQPRQPGAALARRRQGEHPTLGVMEMERIVDRFLVEHLDDRFDSAAIPGLVTPPYQLDVVFLPREEPASVMRLEPGM